MSDAARDFDVVVVGGGMVGAAFAAALSGKGLSIAVIEAREPARDWPEGEIDLRVSALSRASQRILERLDIWSRVQVLGSSPYRHMHVWDAVGGGEIHFDSESVGQADLGHIVENRVIQLALWESLEQLDDVTLFCPGAISDIERERGRSHLLFTDGRAIECGLLVGADGRDSLVRSLAGIETEGWDYGQRAIVANVRPAEWHQETAWQRFLPTGPLALLPLADGRCSIVWSATDARAAALMALDDQDFSNALTDAFEARLGRLTVEGPRAAVPLRLQHAKHYVQHGLALIGDAAHAIHPLAGQGVNLGFLDAAELVVALEHAIGCGRDIGGLWALRRYERSRRGDNMLMLAAMDAFKRLFSNDHPAISAVRSLGLEVTDRVKPVKRLFMTRALGLGVDLPPLAAP
ncbi:UbiH/UbiF/VisC/COQ6 family ubiquinone biosynthesis hydroxylase [Thiorhodococcus mannitoliphagus]|uniref:UbiH/UbiF/VisC/COQ6 family ubiquinone biosynthesis hydroxylase n=1 Tax=Thiorhodococcus mannitoliphagus TaxID=329406 RepID=A0A6P1DYR6_9GAMM|nr:UbiH/UbiF/VisC/COQ6 family ubiquinone biosynthesis hydroxylase [Thiorhodococcus mannitoliphagus]NEX21302.1 UbiH/UbiF/VisC/COQ6 family ubiquinone biosynthesis hydroxylase [Thiorhodococcus mannitoliphagus]